MVRASCGCTYPARGNRPISNRDSDQLIRFGKHFGACDLAISLTVEPTRANPPRMHDVASLLEACLAAERNLVAAAESAGGALSLPDGGSVTVGRAEFDALLGERRKRGRGSSLVKQAPMPARL